MHYKNHSPACERNKRPILTCLSHYLKAGANILEIGSGSGQHAGFFAEQSPQIHWQPTERQENLTSLTENINQVGLSNIRPAIELDVTILDHWPKQSFDLVYTANTLHIMPFESVEILFQHLGKKMDSSSILAIYGPFNYHNQYSSESNAAFDQKLKSVDPRRGIRDFEQVNEMAKIAGYKLIDDHTMPANNQLIVWSKI